MTSALDRNCAAHRCSVRNTLLLRLFGFVRLFGLRGEIWRWCRGHQLMACAGIGRLDLHLCRSDAVPLPTVLGFPVRPIKV